MAKRDVEVEFSLIDGVSKGLAKIDKSLGSVSTQLVSVSAAAVATTAAVGAIAIGAVFADGVKDAAAFEVSLDRISARTGVTGDALAKLGDSIQKISEDATKTGEQGAAAFQKLAEEGLSAEQSLAALPAALDFATASSQGAAEAVGALADTLDQFGLSAENIPRAADVISQAALTAGTGVQQMQAALTAAGPTARDLGITLEQTAASIAVLAQNGIEGGKAGKQLVTIFDQLRDPTSKLRAELEKIGITSTDFKTVLAQLSAAGPKAAGAFNALGAQGTAALKALAKDGGGALSEIAQQLLNVEGATAKTANTINSNFTGALTRLAQAFDAAQVKFLTPLLGPLAEEVDNIRVKLGEFVESPEFKGLSESFATAFLTALEAAKKFAAEFDFADVIEKTKEFVDGVGDDLKEFSDNVETIADAVKGAIASISVALNGLQFVGAKIAEGSTGALSYLAAALSPVSDSAKRASQALAQLSASYRDEASVQARDFGRATSEVGVIVNNATTKVEEHRTAIDELSDAEKAAADRKKNYKAAIEGMAEAFVETKPVVVELTQAQIEQLETNEAIAASQARLKEGVEETNAAIARATQQVGEYNAESAKGATITEDEQKALDKRAESFNKTQEQIQASIDASKNLSSSLSDVKDSAAEAADSMAEFGAAVAQDAGYSDAVFAALGARIDAIAPKIAAIKGVSEKAIRDGVNQDTQGAVRGFTGMNNSLQALEEEFQRLGGDKTLQRMQAEAQRTADAIAGIGEAARGARDDLASLVEQLEAENAARNGNESTAEERRYQQELARIAELDRVSGGTAKAQADLARALAKQNHDARLAEIKEEARVRVESETGADKAIAASRSGATGALSTAPPAAASASGLQAVSNPVTITFNALDLRNAPRFAAQLEAELQRIRRNSR